MIDETALYTAAIQANGQGIEIQLLPPDPAVPGQRLIVKASSTQSSSDAKFKLRNFLQSLRDAAN